MTAAFVTPYTPRSPARKPAMDDVLMMAASALGLHDPCRELTQEEEPPNVHVHRYIPGLFILVHQRPVVGIGPGVVQEDIDPAEFLHHLFDEGLRIFRFGNVGRNGHPLCPPGAYFFRNRLEPLDLPAADHDGGARVGERKGAGATDAATPAGDECDLPFQ